MVLLLSLRKEKRTRTLRCGAAARLSGLVVLGAEVAPRKMFSLSMLWDSSKEQPEHDEEQDDEHDEESSRRSLREEDFLKTLRQLMLISSFDVKLVVDC